ncbi:mechanosensitive ion channel family protein [Parendozoicomonas sp. Alg238-R29]|uniref:mechanosensitive ion channel family protein n=1 Tax=Parendozoicomonas sp. Alg238-R29 TaxID=2993446 RepID=UPI00248DE11F|nr:mechanosensitive ion channel family protein [Parendozoicomonas sp. Alg238-R29]
MSNVLEAVQAWFAAQGSWVFQVFIVLLLTAVAHLVVRIVFGRLEQGLKKTANVWDDALLHATRKPAIALVWVVGLMWAADIARQESQASILKGMGALYDLAIVTIVSWAAIRFIREIEAKYVGSTDPSQVDETTAMAISKLLRAVVIVTSALVVLQTMGYSISGILAFGGIGGIAIGFAAKDLLANFFGGMMIYLDRPFKVGDWIRSPDKNIEGTVEYVGWRQTRIRTFDKRPLYVPNATFSNISVENPSRMENRRIKETIGLRYSDARAMPAVLEEVRSYLVSHEEIDTSKILMVHFNSFGPSSLDFFIYCFTKTCDWARFHQVKEQVMIDILDIIHRHNADVAFPTRTLDISAADLAGAIPAQISGVESAQ